VKFKHIQNSDSVRLPAQIFVEEVDFTGFEGLTMAVMSSSTYFYTDLFLSIFFDPEDEGEMFLRNVILVSTCCMALYHGS
jgi:hypothetical protein